ncbi:hypothetical protein EDD93_1548 [Streptomyces sp. 840.1]|uniref:SRPBCC domain-containing protein n=1 Tax=Streptomyces sp. 840.1 TaxID=2485152 RepID=UPI000F4692F4|nr:SRPBCC domain-containing protein [Streptomyces sp. 840.1]ROQ67130.1 hypothetical protein EDD93_1548 [Streptomyces sp. 840.1]
MATTPESAETAPVFETAADGARDERRRPRRRWIPLSLLALLLALGGYTAWTHASPVRLTASVDIEASPDQVWKVLTDLSQYPEWNPFVTRSEVISDGGHLVAGATMRNRLTQPSGASTFTPEVLVAHPGRELRWLGKVGPGWLLDAEHRFQIERTGDGTVRLTQSEKFTGVLLPFAKGQLEGETLPQFRAMNEALKHRVEAQK